MGKKDSREHRRKHIVLGEETEVGSIYNISESVKNIKKLYEMSQSLDKDLTDILLYYGEKGLSVNDIGVVANIPKKAIKDIFSKGEQDFELGIKSVQADYYRAYMTGRKMFEISTTQNASKKDPMKLLAILNPVEYGDKITDKYELPTININFGGDGIKAVLEDTEREEEEVDE